MKAFRCSGLVLLATVLFTACSRDDVPLARTRVAIDTWDSLPPATGARTQPGLAGAYSGLVGGRLLIAGGANFPRGMPWHGGEKVWHERLYARNLAEEGWEEIEGVFPRPLAYGTSVALPQGLLCIGGCDAHEASSDVFLLTNRNGTIASERWPPLPVPLSNAAATVVNGTIYLAGGQSDTKRPEALSVFYALDPKNRAQGWRALPSWSGPPRAYAAVACQSDGADECLYLFGGRDYGPGRPIRPLADSYKYNPRTNRWTQLDIEGRYPVMAGTAAPIGAHHILLVGGSDGRTMLKEEALRDRIARLAASDAPAEYGDSLTAATNRLKELLDNHPGFGGRISLYHTVTNTLVDAPPTGMNLPVTTNLLAYGNDYLLTGGEVRPGVRTPAIYRLSIVAPPRRLGLLNGAVIVVYFAVLAGMGFYFARRQKSSDDYFRGGGRLPWWAVGLSIFGTSLSAITFMAIPAKAYATDWSYMLMNAGILLVVPVVIRLFIPYFRRLDVTTAYEYLERRFNPATRLICSLSFILFQLCRMAVVLLLPSIALHVAAGLDLYLCIGLMGGLALVYTMLGGIEAVVWTDALQVVILLGGAIFAVGYMMLRIDGGVTGALAEGALHGKFFLGSLRFDLTEPTIWTVLIASFFTNLTTYGTDQTMVQRYLTTPDEKKASRSVKLNAWLTIPATLIFFAVGTCLFVFYRHNPGQLDPTLTDGDAIFPWFIASEMPQGLSGLLIAGIFAAAMSTLSSSINSAATAYAVDIHFRYGWSRGRDPLRLARLFTAILGAAGVGLALMMASWEVGSLWDEFQKLLGLILGGLGGLFLLGMLTRRANGTGALIGLCGSIVVQLVVGNTHAVHLLLYATTGFISCFVLGYLGSLLFPNGNRHASNHRPI